jgi:hypothetical protein
MVGLSRQRVARIVGDVVGAENSVRPLPIGAARAIDLRVSARAAFLVSRARGYQIAPNLASVRSAAVPVPGVDSL